MSVVLPTYDRPEKLLEAAESVAAQTYDEIELIVVDDASPTPARKVLEGRSFADLRWRCIRHESNQGANAARNTGIRESEGELVAFIDDDDYWLPETVEAYVSAFQRGGESTGVAVVAQRYQFEGEVTSVRTPEVDGDATVPLLEGKTAGTFSAIAVRRSAIDAAGLPDERLPSWQDREWLLRLSRHCRFAVDPRPLVVRRGGEYAQIADEYELQRDVSYPLLLKKHRGLAAEYDREDDFVASLARNLAGNALREDRTADARRFATTAVRLDPRAVPAWIFLGLSLTGPRFYRMITRLKRQVARRVAVL